MTCWLVSARVGNIKNNDSNLVEPTEWVVWRVLRGGEHSDARLDSDGKALHVDCKVPSAGARDLKAKGRLPGQASEVAVPTSGLIVAEV